MKRWHSLANPSRFVRLAKFSQPWFAGLAGVTFTAGLILALYVSPPDYQQGDAVRILYVHVPSAWMSLFVYATLAFAALATLIWRHPLAGVWCRAVAPIGCVFTALCLITGMIWGEPIWGTWWVWDARLTSVLILFFFYIAYIALVSAFDDEERGIRSGAILLLIGAIDLPIVKFSVDWWATLHQPASVSRLAAPALHSDMLWPLVAMFVAFKAIFLFTAFVRVRTLLLERRLQRS